MKRIAIALVTCVVIVSMTAAPVLAAAQKVELEECPLNYPNCEVDPATCPPGGGFVIYNNPAGEGHNLELTVSLKGVEPNTAYDIYFFVDGVWYDGAKIATVITNPKGNANFHISGLLSEGQHVLAIDVTKEGSFADVYETPGIHANQGTLMTFE